MRLEDVTFITAVILLSTVICDNYIILPEDDLSCKRNDRQNLHSPVTVDDVVLHEQLVLQWAFPESNSTDLRHLGEDTYTRPIVGACSGIIIRPSGRFVTRLLSDGLVSFWLLRAEVLFKCPDGFTKPDEYFVHIEQWIETNSWTTATHGSTPFHSSYDQDSSHPIAYNAVPDKIIRLNCSSGKKSIREHIAGYIRRLRVSWKLNGALSPPPPVWTTPSPQGDKKRSRNSTWELLTHRRPLHPDFGFGLRFTSRMLFEGNLGSDRKRVLCEFFSGFWCNSVQPDVTSRLSSDNHRILAEPDRESCVPASMRCDRLPDCDLTLTTDDDLVNRSADEAYCNVYSGKYSFGQLDHALNATLSDRWSSRLPWIVVAPVPLVLVCALVRICSQKRLLELDDEGGDVSGGFRHETEHFHSNSADHKLSQNSKDVTVNGRGVLKAKCRNPRHGVFYGPVTALSSVAEVDEFDTEIRSHLSDTASKSMEGSFVTGGPPLSAELALANSPQHPDAEALSADAVFMPCVVNCSNQSLQITHPATDQCQLSRDHKSRAGRRSYLCWSAFFDSSSSSSCSSGSHPSPCSRCSAAPRCTTDPQRSQSCGELHRYASDNQLMCDNDPGLEMQRLQTSYPAVSDAHLPTANGLPSPLEADCKTDCYCPDRCTECLVHAANSTEQLDTTQHRETETVHVRSFSLVDYVPSNTRASEVGAGHRPSDSAVSEMTELASLPTLTTTSSTTALLDNECLEDTVTSKG